MFFWILFAIVAIWFLGSLVGIFVTKDPGAVASGVAAFLVGAIVWVAFSITTVDARAVGIQTSFGRYVDTVDNGLHFVAPWSSVEEFSTRVQTLDFNGGDEDDDKPPIRISFRGGANGEAQVTVRWRIDTDNAQDLWVNYKEFSEVRDKLVQAEARDSFRTVFSDYTPSEGIDGRVQRELQEQVEEDLRNLLRDDGIIIDSIAITRVDPSKEAQAAINRIVEAEANTQRAQAEQERAEIEAETARIRQQTLTPEALTRYCLEVLNAWSVEKNGNPPATLNCGLGESSPVLVGAR